MLKSLLLMHTIQCNTIQYSIGGKKNKKQSQNDAVLGLMCFYKVYVALHFILKRNVAFKDWTILFQTPLVYSYEQWLHYGS